MNAYKSVFRAEISDHIAMRSSIYSERTMRATVSVLLEFDGYLCDIGLYEKKLNEPIVENWIQGLSGKSHTVAGKVSQLRLFCKHLHTGGIDAYIPPAYKARDEYVPYLFSDEEYEQIFCTADNINFSVNQANPWIQIEFPVILRLLYSCGLRLGEALSLQIQNIFKKYVSLARKRHPNLFRAKSYSPHSMRHSTATHMLEAGVPLIVIKNFLGHSSLQTTQVYAAVSQCTLNKHIQDWNKKWFSDDGSLEHQLKAEIPSFLI